MSGISFDQHYSGYYRSLARNTDGHITGVGDGTPDALTAITTSLPAQTNPDMKQRVGLLNDSSLSVFERLGHLKAIKTRGELDSSTGAAPRLATASPEPEMPPPAVPVSASIREGGHADPFGQGWFDPGMFSVGLGDIVNVAGGVFSSLFGSKK